MQVDSPKRKILLADDSSEMRALVSLYLKDVQCGLVAVSNGIEAVSAFRKNHDICMVLMDMEMPVMDGYTAARAIRAHTDGMIIVAMTAHEGEDAIKACMKAGCTAYLKKPVVRDELLRLVSDALGLAVTSADDEGKIYDEMVYIDPDIAPLVPGYLQNRRVDSERIGSLLLQGDLETIRIIGHSMSGSAGGYGFPEIGRIGRKIELAALDNNTEAIDKLNRQLSDYLCNLRYGLRDTA